MLFAKKVYIFRKKDRATWLKIKAVLKEAGIKKVSAGHYLQDKVIGGGTGPIIDPRDYGPKGYIDHDVYYVKVREEDEEKAKRILTENGIAAEVMDSETLMTDAALRIKKEY